MTSAPQPLLPIALQHVASQIAPPLSSLPLSARSASWLRSAVQIALLACLRPLPGYDIHAPAITPDRSAPRRLPAQESYSNYPIGAHVIIPRCPEPRRLPAQWFCSECLVGAPRPLSRYDIYAQRPFLVAPHRPDSRPNRSARTACDHSPDMTSTPSDHFQMLCTAPIPRWVILFIAPELRQRCPCLRTGRL